MGPVLDERLGLAVLVETSDVVEKFVVACPMCLTMYEDGRKTGGYEDEIEIVDVAELLVEAIESAPGADAGVDTYAAGGATGQAD